MKQEGLALPINILGNEGTLIENVRCKIFLPVRSTGDIRLKLYPTEEQHSRMQRMWKFSAEGEFKDSGGTVFKTVKANNVYWVNKEDEYTTWLSDRAEYIRSCEPTDLKLTYIFREDPPELENKIKGSFWITPNPLFSHVRAIIPADGGGFSVETSYQSRFTLQAGFELIFRQQYKLYRNEEDERVYFSEPILEFEADRERSSDLDSENLHQYIDDFLLLASFAARQRSMCVGWEVGTKGSYTEFYRRDITIPRTNKDRNFENELIASADFEEFMGVASTRFYELGQNEFLRRAINYTIPKDAFSLESYYMLLFAALETLVSHFRSEVKLEKILPDKLAKKMKSELNAWLDNQPLEEVEPENREAKRSFIREKFLELNRVSFAAAFKKLCEFYSVDLSDLWPIIGNKEGPSLSLIRHKLVHGASFNYRPTGALFCAAENLKWSIERMILSILGWPVAKSRVRAEYLSRVLSMHQQWKSKRESLKNS